MRGYLLFETYYLGIDLTGYVRKGANQTCVRPQVRGGQRAGEKCVRSFQRSRSPPAASAPRSSSSDDRSICSVATRSTARKSRLPYSSRFLTYTNCTTAFVQSAGCE